MIFFFKGMFLLRNFLGLFSRWDAFLPVLVLGRVCQLSHGNSSVFPVMAGAPFIEAGAVGCKQNKLCGEGFCKEMSLNQK